MAVPSEDWKVSKWYQALFEEDCVQVTQLLKKQPSLLMEGCKSSSRIVRGRRRNFWMDRTESSWKGRTALHVGARRGCVELVEKVISLCYDKEELSLEKGQQGAAHWVQVKEAMSSKVNKQPTPVSSLFAQDDSEVAHNAGRNNQGNIDIAGSSHSHVDGPVTTPKGNLREADKKGKNAAGPTPSQDDAFVSLEGNPQEANETADPAINISTIEEDIDNLSSDEGTLSNLANSESELEDKTSEMAQRTLAHWKRYVEGRRSKEGTVSLAFAHWKRKLSTVNSRVQERDTSLVSLKDLLVMKDGEYDLDALAMAALHANRDIISLLIPSARYPRQTGPQHSDGEDFEDNSQQNTSRDSGQLTDSVGRDQVKTLTNRVIRSIMADPFSRKSCHGVLNAYWKHRDFNFLPLGEYLFHFLFTNYFQTLRNDAGPRIQARLIRVYLWEEFNSYSTYLWEQKKNPFKNSLWRYLLQLRDGQGRTPLHVSVDEGTVETFLDLLEEREGARNYAMTVCDAAGRTALHRAVAIGNLDAVMLMRNTISPVGFERAFQQEWRHSMQVKGLDGEDMTVDGLSDRNGFKGRKVIQLIKKHKTKTFLTECTPLQSAIIHKRTKILDELKLTEFFLAHPSFIWIQESGSKINLDPLELATVAGEVNTVRRLLKVGIGGGLPNLTIGGQRKVGIVRRLLQRILGRAFYEAVAERYMGIGPSLNSDRAGHAMLKPRYFAAGCITCPWPPIHLAASCGNYEVLKAFTETPSWVCDPYVEDEEKNTVLHHAMKVKNVKFELHLLDFVDCEHVHSNDPRKTSDNIVERQGCINLLLQSGCDIFVANEEGRVPYPTGDLSTNASFLSWWYEKQSKEFGMTQNNMNFAANAISVTATLVATASYVGPAQPPLGYDGSPATEIQVTNIWVRIFIICDTLSFYLAIAAITFSLIPSLPMPQQPMIDELRRTSHMITSAVATLVPSIICILVAFAASSISVVIANGASSTSGSLTIITTAIGGFFCLGGFILLSIRLLGILFPRNSWVRKIYNFTSF